MKKLKRGKEENSKIISPIYVSNFDHSHPKFKERQVPTPKSQDNRKIGNSNPKFKNSVEREYLNIPSFENSITPHSFTLERMSLNSRYTNRSHRSFTSKNSQRLLFQDNNEVRKHSKRSNIFQKGDFLCTCTKNNLLEYYLPAMEMHPYKLHPLLTLEDESDKESILVDDMIKSMSGPVQENSYFDEKFNEPLALERQPFSNVTNFAKASINYGNPLDKIDLKHGLKIENN